jgi:hypothetical protein
MMTRLHTIARAAIVLIHTCVAPIVVASLAAAVTSGCSVTEPVRVLDRGEVRLTGSVGGPVVPSSMPTVVVPYATAGAMVGISDNVTVTGNLHLVLMAIKTFGIDGGAAIRILPEEGAIPELTLKGQALVMTNFTAGSLRVFPFCSVNGSYRLGEAVLCYGGVESMFQFTGDDHYFVGPFAGVQIQLSRRVGMQTEAKWMAANINTRDGVFEGQSSFHGKGSFGLFLGVSYVW